jgi:hypothetical protein
MNPKTAKGIQKYGKVWNIPHPALIDLFCYARHGDPVLAEGLGKHMVTKTEFMLRAIRTLYTPDQFRINPWSERMIELWCESPVGAVWGCTGSGKSTTMGMIALMDILPAPAVTYTCLVTSPAKEHPNRTWGNVVKYYSLLPDMLKIGTIKQVPLGLHTVDNTGGKRAGIHCYSTEQGESAEDFKKRVGAHQKRNRFIVDEAQKCSTSVLSAFSNLGSVGEYQEMFIFNPASWFSADGKVSIPKPPMTIKRIEEEEPDEWEMKRSFRGVHGKVIVLDGARSPALTDTSLEGLIIDRHHLQTIAENSGEDSFEYWSQGRGRMAPEGAVATFVSRKDLEDAGCLQPGADVRFDTWTDVAGLDPSEGRDDCCTVACRVGPCPDGVTRIAIVNERKIPISIKAGDISGQISTAFTAYLRQRSIPLRYAGVDATGGGAQADQIDRDYGSRGILRIMWQGPSSDRRVSSAAHKNLARDIYYDHATELFAQVASLARQGRIIGISDAVAYQLTTRIKLIQAGRARVEPKDDWRDRNEGKSPNDLDALICAVETAIERGLIKPYLPISSPNPHSPQNPRSQNPQNRPGLRERTRRASIIASKR